LFEEWNGVGRANPILSCRCSSYSAIFFSRLQKHLTAFSFTKLQKRVTATSFTKSKKHVTAISFTKSQKRVTATSFTKSQKHVTEATDPMNVLLVFWQYVTKFIPSRKHATA
jgi:hypothetical protein